ncbi:DUF2889 domain-containing protein [Alkalilimnicola ehrlichii MLHE-1]|nr:DUF2889 domain-containing protein [Alkalilimnicola ehrlichii]
MPLPPAAERTPIHRRQIECDGYRREAGEAVQVLYPRHFRPEE